MTERSHGGWYYQQVSLGFNYRMTEIQAALGLSQMNRLGEFVVQRSTVARRYNTALSGMPVSCPWQHPDGSSAWHLYVVRLKLDKIKRTHLEVFEEMRAAGVGVNLHYIPVYLHPYYQSFGFRPGYCPEAENYYSEAISLPLFPGLSLKEQDHVVATLQSALGGRPSA